jgi:MFS family permease
VLLARRRWGQPWQRVAELLAPSRLGRSFRWLLASSWVTNLGDGITLAAGPLLVASVTRDPLAVAMAALLQRLPWLLFGLYAGVVADRLNRRAIVIVTGLVRVAILVLLTTLIVTRHVDITLVLAVLFLFGVTETFGDTTTATLLPMLVDKPDLGIANARALTGVIVWNQLAGPPVGAVLFAAGRALPFVSEGVCVLAGLLLITRVRLPPHGTRGQRTRVHHDIREGWRWLWAHAALRTLAITIFTFNVTFGAAWSVLVLYARERLGMGPLGFGLITTAIAAGGLLGTASYGWLERHVRLGVIMRGGLIIETLTHLWLHRDHRDLDEPFGPGQRRHDQAGEHRVDPGKVPAEHPVHRLAVADVGEVDGAGHHVLDGRAGLGQQRPDVRHHLLGLRLGITHARVLARVEVLRHLAAQVDGVAGYHRLAQVVVQPLLRIAVGGVERPDPQVAADRDRVSHFRTSSATAEYLATRSSGPLKS